MTDLSHHKFEHMLPVAATPTSHQGANGIEDTANMYWCLLFLWLTMPGFAPYKTFHWQ
jgi:hypothetical protein